MRRSPAEMQLTRGFRFDLFIDSLSGMLQTAVILLVFGLCSPSGSSCFAIWPTAVIRPFFCRLRLLRRVGRIDVVTSTTRISINSSTTLKLTALRVQGRRRRYSLVGGTSKYHPVIGVFLAFDKFLVRHSRRSSFANRTTGAQRCDGVHASAHGETSG